MLSIHALSQPNVNLVSNTLLVTLPELKTSLQQRPCLKSLRTVKLEEMRHQDSVRKYESWSCVLLNVLGRYLPFPLSPEVDEQPILHSLIPVCIIRSTVADSNILCVSDVPSAVPEICEKCAPPVKPMYCWIYNHQSGHDAETTMEYYEEPFDLILSRWIIAM